MTFDQQETRRPDPIVADRCATLRSVFNEDRFNRERAMRDAEMTRLLAQVRRAAQTGDAR